MESSLHQNQQENVGCITIITVLPNEVVTKSVAVCVSRHRKDIKRLYWF